MNAKTFEVFEAEARARGFDEALERKWAPDTVVDVHSHEFDARALVIAGEMWLTCDGNTQHLRAGDTFARDSRVPHSERYGPYGATYWVARRSSR